MPKLTNNTSRPASAFAARRELNNKPMKKELVLPLVAGIILGGLVMIFWQFNARLNNQIAAVAQLEQATAQNTKNVNDIITFINNATGANKQGAAATPAAPETPAE